MMRKLFGLLPLATAFPVLVALTTEARSQNCSSSENCAWHSGGNCIVGRDRNGNSIYGIEHRERCQVTHRFIQNGRCVGRLGQTYTRQTRCLR